MTIGSIKHYRSRKHGYEPLLKHSQLPTVHHYGSAAISDSASDDTITHDITIEASRWTMFNLSRFLLSLAQLALCIVAIQKIHHKTYEFTENEGSEHEILGAYMTQTAFWVSFFIFASQIYYVLSLCLLTVSCRGIIGILFRSFNREYLSLWKLHCFGEYYM